MAGRPLRRARRVLLNPRRTLRRDAVMAVEEATIPVPPPLSPGEIGTAHEDRTFKPGQFWLVVTFFDPQILRGHPGGGEYDPWNREQYRWYEKNVLGGVWIRWDSEEDYFMEEKPGTVEFLAAGAGYGPDVIEAAARAAEVPLVLDPKHTWEARELFKHYGGSVPPTAARFLFRKVPLTKPLTDTSGLVKRVAASAYNKLGSPHLPRYQEDSDSFRQDLEKVESDTRAAANPRRPRAPRRLRGRLEGEFIPQGDTISGRPRGVAQWITNDSGD